ncbi:MAG: preprotein translocase subunit YajC [Calditrichaeota bacterium]|nr:preprotein translocase subunit YajC [Calditrichota bacterium]
MLLLTIAMAPAPGGQPQGGSGFMAFLPFILMIVIVWLLILRPQAKRQKEHQKMLDALDRGDHIVTTGGIHGTVQRVNEKEGTMIIKIDDNVKVEIDRGAVARKIARSD